MLSPHTPTPLPAPTIDSPEHRYQEFVTDVMNVIAKSEWTYKRIAQTAGNVSEGTIKRWVDRHANDEYFSPRLDKLLAVLWVLNHNLTVTKRRSH